MISKDHMIRDKDGGKNEYKKNTTPSKNTQKKTRGETESHIYINPEGS